LPVLRKYGFRPDSVSLVSRAEMKNTSDIERRIIAVLQEGLPRTQTPYEDMAGRIGIETDELLTVLKEWKKQGKLRRIGAIVNHFKVGLAAGAMVVWQAEDERIEEIGKMFAGFEQVSHAYERRTCDNWQYNLYTMVHGETDEDVRQTVERMSEASGVANYRLLLTERELKKVPPTYIIESDC
jgi:DNA-binding Lrp family transcriptional regulator